MKADNEYERGDGKNGSRKPLRYPTYITHALHSRDFRNGVDQSCLSNDHNPCIERLVDFYATTIPNTLSINGRYH